MSNEGELIKRIIKTSFGDRNVSNKRCFVNMINVNKTVNEAKKDFPQITNYKTENYWELHLKRIEWFLKWFGDAL